MCNLVRARTELKQNLDWNRIKFPTPRRRVRACHEYREGFFKSNQSQILLRAALWIYIKNYMVSAMIPVALFSLFILIDAQRPTTRSRPKPSIINHAPIIFLSLLLTGR